MHFHEKYLDVLQNMEFAVVQAYRENPALRDSEVISAYEAVVDYYRAEAVGRQPRNFNLSEPSELVFEKVIAMCEWRLGREPSISMDTGEDISPDRPQAIDEIVRCLKKLSGSAEKWNRRGGVDGYLRFISRFVK